jgi:hypothetical protein
VGIKHNLTSQINNFIKTQMMKMMSKMIKRSLKEKK